LIDFDAKYDVSKNVTTVACTSAVLSLGSGMVGISAKYALGAFISSSVADAMEKTRNHREYFKDRHETSHTFSMRKQYI